MRNRIVGGLVVPISLFGCMSLKLGDAPSPPPEGDAAADEVEASIQGADGGDAATTEAFRSDDVPALDRSAYPGTTRWWERGAGGNGHGYLVVVTPGTVSWDVARDAAKSTARGHLVTLTSIGELKFVQALLGDTPDAFRITGLRRDGPWIGLSRRGNGLAVFAWVNGEPYTHELEMWSPGEPTNEPPGEPYVHLVGFTTSNIVLFDDTTSATPTTSYVVEIE